MMMEMVDFDLSVCSRNVSDQNLEKAITKVLQTFDGVEKLTAEQRYRLANFIRGNDVLAILPTIFLKSLLFQLIPEALIVNEKWRTMLQTTVYKKKTSGLLLMKLM